MQFLILPNLRLQFSGGYQFPLAIDTTYLRNSINNEVSGWFSRIGLNIVVFKNRAKTKEIFGIIPEFIFGTYTHRNTLMIKDFYGARPMPFTHSESYSGLGLKYYLNVFQTPTLSIYVGASVSTAISPTFFKGIAFYPYPGARSTGILLGISYKIRPIS